MNRQLVIIGASGHGKVIADIAKKLDYNEIVFLDDDTTLVECNGYRVVGTTKDVKSYKSYEFVVAIGNAEIRKKIQNQLSNENITIATLVHPNAVIGENVVLGEGTVVMAGAVVNPCVTIGNGCIINTCTSVDHDCVIGDFAHISVGAHIAGTVTIGECTWIGAGATIINNLNICGSCMIGAGAVIINNIDEPGTYVGVPARLKG